MVDFNLSEERKILFDFIINHTSLDVANRIKDIIHNQDQEFIKELTEALCPEYFERIGEVVSGLRSMDRISQSEIIEKIIRFAGPEISRRVLL